MQEQQESQFLVTDAVTKYNDFIFVQSDINITDMPLESTNMTIPPFITGAINIVVQTNHMLESIRYIAKQDDYIKNTDVRLFNDNCCDLGGINGTVINQSSQKTMLQSIQLQLTSTSRSMITNVIIIESYLLMNKCIIQQSNEANVRDDFNRFIDKNKDNKIVVLLNKDIYDVIEKYNVFERGEKLSFGYRFFDNIDIISVNSEKLESHAVEFTHGRQIIENEHESNISINLSNYEPIFAKTNEITSKVDIKCRTNTLEVNTKISKTRLFSIFKLLKQELKDSDIVLTDTKSGNTICTIPSTSVVLDEDSYKQEFIRTLLFKNLIANTYKKYNDCKTPEQQLLLIPELEQFMISNNDEFNSLTRLFNDIYNKDDTSIHLLFSETKTALVNIFTIIYTIGTLIKNFKSNVNMIEYKKKNTILEDEFTKSYSKFSVFIKHNHPSQPSSLLRQYSN
jgi:hypothetical protein